MNDRGTDRKLLGWLRWLALVAVILLTAYIVTVAPRSLLLLPWLMWSSPVLSIPPIVAILLMIFLWREKRRGHK